MNFDAQIATNKVDRTFFQPKTVAPNIHTTSTMVPDYLGYAN